MNFEDFEKGRYEKQTGKKTIHVIIHREDGTKDHREWLPWNLKQFIIKKSQYLLLGYVIKENCLESYKIVNLEQQKRFYNRILQLLENGFGPEAIIRVELIKE